MRTIDVGLRLGDTIDPFHLANCFEVLSGTNAKNGAITPSLILTVNTSHARCDKVSEWVGGSLQCKRGILVILWKSIVDVAFVSNNWTF